MSDLDLYRQPCGNCNGHGEIDNPAYLARIAEHPEPKRDPGIEYRSPEWVAWERAHDVWLDELAAWHKAHGLETFTCAKCQGSGKAKLLDPVIWANPEEVAGAVEKLRAIHVESEGECTFTRADIWAAVIRALQEFLTEALKDPGEYLYDLSSYQHEVERERTSREGRAS